MRNYQTEIYASRVTLSGKYDTYDKGGVSIFSGNAHQTAPRIACVGAYSCLVVWVDNTSTNSQILGADNAFKPTSILYVEKKIAVSKASGNTHHSPVVATDGVNYMVSWVTHLSTSTRTIYGRRISATGVPYGTVELPQGGITTGTVSAPAIAFMPDAKKYLVVWEDGRNKSSDIYGSRVDPYGKAHDSTGLGLATGTGYRERPSVACFKDTCLLTYGAGTSSKSITSLYAKRLSEVSGKLKTQDTTGILLHKAYDIASPTVVSDGNGSFVPFWRETPLPTSTYAYLRTLKFQP